jgi:hypothetical protein
MCAACGHRTSVTAGTIFDRTRTPLTVWFHACWMFATAKDGISALSLQRSLEIGSYQTAWAMLGRLRSVLVRPGRDPLAGRVEVDETYIGGRSPGCAPAKAVLYGPKPPPTGKRGRPRAKGDRIGTCKDAAATADWRETVIHAYGEEATVQVAARDALWYGSFKSAPGQLVLVREPGSRKPCDLGIFTLDTEASAEAVAERYSG